MRDRFNLQHWALYGVLLAVSFTQPAASQTRTITPVQIGVGPKPIKNINFEFLDPQGVNPCCAPWAETKIPLSLQPIFQGSAAGPYTLNYAAAPGVNAQMQAFLNYASTVCLGCTQVKVTWQIANLGNGATYALSGPPAAPTANVIWNAGGGGVTTGGSFWGGFPFQPNVWYGVKTSVSHNGQANCPLFPSLCANDKWIFRWSSMGARSAGGSPLQEGVLEVVDPSGRISRSEPVRIEASQPLQMPQTSQK